MGLGTPEFAADILVRHRAQWCEDDRLGRGFVMVENLFRGQLPCGLPWHRNPFFIRVIREIRGYPLIPLRAGI